MAVFLLLLFLAQSPVSRPSVLGPFIPITVWYPAHEDVEVLRRELAMLRKAGFNAVTTGIAWRDGEPQSGAYSLLKLDRVIAVATETGLRVEVLVDTDTPPAWIADRTDARAAQFYEYVRRRVSAQPAVFEVVLTSNPREAETTRVIVGTAPGASTPREARRTLWSALASGSRKFRFTDPEHHVSPHVLQLGETVGVITRNPALFVPLKRRLLKDGDVTIAGGEKISIDILESNDAIVIVGANHEASVRKATISFPRDIPEAIWQNMEEGMAVHFVMGSTGPVLEHVFAPDDVLVLAIRKQRR